MTSARLLTLILTALFFISATLAGAGDARAEAARAAHARMDERLIASIPTYDLVIRLVPDSHQMEVTGTILLPASGETRPTITLVLSSLMSDLRVELLEEGGTGVHVDATVEASDAKAGPTRWTLHPPNPIPANKPVRFRLTYASHDGTAFSFYIGPEGSFAGNGSCTRWYPQLPAYAA